MSQDWIYDYAREIDEARAEADIRPGPEQRRQEQAVEDHRNEDRNKR